MRLSRRSIVKWFKEKLSVLFPKINQSVISGKFAKLVILHHNQLLGVGEPPSFNGNFRWRLIHMPPLQVEKIIVYTLNILFTISKLHCHHIHIINSRTEWDY